MFVSFLSDVPKTKWLGLKSSPRGPALTESMVPGSRSTKMARGTYFPGTPSLPKQKELNNIAFVRITLWSSSSHIRKIHKKCCLITYNRRWFFPIGVLWPRGEHFPSKFQKASIHVRHWWFPKTETEKKKNMNSYQSTNFKNLMYLGNDNNSVIIIRSWTWFMQNASAWLKKRFPFENGKE